MMGGGLTFIGSRGQTIFKGAKRAKVGKNQRKLEKQLNKAAAAGTFGREMEISCSKESLRELGKVAKDRTAPRPERMVALNKLDKAAFECQGVSGGASKAVVTKAEKKDVRKRRAQLEWQAFNHPDLAARVRAQDQLFGSLGG